MIELNLLPDVKKEFIRAQRTRNTVISIAILATIGAAAIIVLLAMTVYVLQTATINLQTQSIKDKAKALQGKQEINKYLTVQNQLQNIDALHTTKPLYSRAFNYVQSLNPAAPNNVALTEMTLTAEGASLEIEGTANNFAALAVFKTTLENAALQYKQDGSDEQLETPLFDTVTLLEASVANIEGRLLTVFRIKLVYPEDIFLASVKDPKVKVPSEITSDADRNAPRQVFGGNPEETQ